MSIKYSKVWMRNPRKPMDPKKVYAKAQAREEVDEFDLSEEIGWGTSATNGDTVNVVYGVGERIAWHLSNGDTVDLGELGTFCTRLSSKGAVSRDEFSHHNIKKVNIRFRPGKLMRKALEKLEFEHVILLESEKEARRKEKTGLSDNG